jgi:hypothetical protein
MINHSCKKDPFTNDPEDKLMFSKDTVTFDTIFTDIGSSTRSFVVKNSNKDKLINIDKIYVAKQSNSKYKLNIDGVSSNSISNKVIYPGDSIHIFVMVKIDPNKDQMIEQDSIIFISNGNMQDVKLIAYGQDVKLLNGANIESDTTWTSAKPVLIYNRVSVLPNVKLTVDAGTKVYFHKNSSLFIFGTIHVNGSTTDRVLFTGDRLEKAYSDIPGQWGAYDENERGEITAIYGGIHLFETSINNIVNNADIKNSTIGLQVASNLVSETPNLILKNTNIENSQIAAMYALGANLYAENCVFANSGQYNLGCVMGGKYTFIHCTMANYWRGNRQVAQILFNNNFIDNNGGVITRDLTANFGNSIIYGSRENEIAVDYNSGSLMNLGFESCLIKYKDTVSLKMLGYFENNIFNKDPKFKEVRKAPYDYKLDTLSSVKDVGDYNIGIMVPLDQSGNSRLSDGKPDLGAFERTE